MIMAKHKLLPPSEWRHDPALRDQVGKTVADRLRANGIPVPPEWVEDAKTPAMQTAARGKIPLSS